MTLSVIIFLDMYSTFFDIFFFMYLVFNFKNLKTLIYSFFLWEKLYDFLLKMYLIMNLNTFMCILHAIQYFFLNARNTCSLLYKLVVLYCLYMYLFKFIMVKDRLSLRFFILKEKLSNLCREITSVIFSVCIHNY